MQKRAPWLAVPIGTVDCLIRIFEASHEPWPRAAASLDLARHLDLTSSGRAHTFPSRRSLAARWGWTEASVRGLLVSRHEWSDPTKETYEPAIRPTLAQRSPKGRPAETVAPAQSDAVSPNARPELTQRSPTTRPDVLPDSLENLAFEYGLSEVGTLGDTSTTTSHNHKNNTYVRGEPDPDQRAEPEPPMHQTIADDIRRRTANPVADLANVIAKALPVDEDAERELEAWMRSHGSSPTTPTDATDNDGEDTSPPVRPAPSPSTLTAAPATTPATAPPPLAAPSVVAPNERQGGAGAFTLSPPSKPKGKRKAATEITEDQIASVAVFVDRITGKPGRCLPGSTRWKRLTNAIKGAGLSKVYARMEATADAAEGKASPASETWKVMTSRGCTVDNMIWDHNGWTASIDTAIEDAAIDAAERASETTGAAGGVVGRLEPQNRSQGQAAPKQSGSGAWDDMLATIRAMHGSPRLSLGVRGSTLSHDPAEQARRAAAIVAIGGWAKICDAGDHNRGIVRAQFVAAYDRAGVTA